MSLRKALGWSVAQTGVRICLGFLSAKISAIYLGPAGVALVGQLASFLNLMHGAIGTAANTAVVNLTANRRASPVRLNDLWATALRLVWVLALGCFLVVGGGSQPIANWLLGDSQYWPAVAFCGFAVLLVVTETVISGALNGLKQVRLIAKTNIASSVVEVTVFATLVYSYGLWGGLIGTAALYFAKLAITCLVAFRSGLVSRSSLVGPFDTETAREIARFYPMLLVHAIALPLGQILVRNSVIEGAGLVTAGYLQAVWRLSDMYVGVMTTALGLYFMAQYSSLANQFERAKLIRRTILQLSGLAIIAASIIYVLRFQVITIVLTAQFLPMEQLLPFHLAGDVLKIAGYPLAMALVAERQSYWYAAQAGGGPMIFALVTPLLLPIFGSQAAPMAYAGSYLIVFVAMAYALRKLLTSSDAKLKEEDQQR